MLYEFYKYKDIESFIKNSPKGKNAEKYTVLFKCNGISNITGTPKINENCFGCMFCIFEHPDIISSFKELWGNDFIKQTADSAFLGVPVRMPVSKRALRAPYKSLEKFTEVDETVNIQPWATGIVNHISSESNRVSMEIPVFNTGYNRNGRLDICAITESGKLLTMESKISLDDALKDERFVEQHKKYTEEIEKYSTSYTYLTLFGGKETDMYPTGSPYCTGTVGEKSSRFYNILEENNIRFITANALLCLCCKFITYGNKYAWDKFLTESFDDPKCIGLLSAGKVILDGGGKLIIQSV